MLRSFRPFAACLALAAVLAAAGCGKDDPDAPLPAARALCEEGTADLQAFRFRDAVDKLGECLALDPSVAEAAVARAEAYAALPDPKAARREFVRADSLAGHLRDDRRRMLVQLRLGRHPGSRYHADADSLLERLIRLAPDDLHVVEARARAAGGRGDVDQAVEIWSRLLELNPNHAAAHNQLGYLELNRGRYDVAIEHFKRYIFLAPELANPHDSYGEVLLVLGRYEEAAREFVTALELQPEFYVSLINLGRSHLARGRTAKGEAILEKVRERVRGSAIEREVDFRILTSHLVAGRHDRLNEVSRDYIARYPQDPLVPLFRCLLLAATGRTAEGFAVADSALAARRGADRYAEDPAARVATEIFANQYEGLKRDLLGEPEAAAAAWAASIRLMDGNAPLHEQFFHRSRLAAALLRQGDAAGALAQIDTIQAVNPRVISVLALAVEARLALGDRAGASAECDRLEQALADADADYPPRTQAAELRRRIALPAGG